MSNRSDGSTASYYELPKSCTELQHLISHRDMNAQIGEIFRACYRYGIASHSDRLRDARKIKFYIDAEIARLEAIEALDKEREIWIPVEPASEIDDESERQQLVQQSGEMAEHVYPAVDAANCECHACIAEKKLGRDMAGFGFMPLSSMKMILCPVCGNKRCPRASDHRLACTGSNEPGQPGSIYQ